MAIGLSEHLRCADKCSKATRFDANGDSAAALDTLHSCGVVHLANLVDKTFLNEIIEAVKGIRGRSELIDNSHLRAGLTPALTLTLTLIGAPTADTVLDI